MRVGIDISVDKTFVRLGIGIGIGIGILYWNRIFYHQRDINFLFFCEFQGLEAGSIFDRISVTALESEIF